VPIGFVTVKLSATPILAATLLLAVCAGCSLCATKWERERVHNPFPQLKRVAVLPFFNQSSEPTLDTELVAEKYYGALQSVPGFEVLPVGVTKIQWLQYSRQYGEPTTGEQFQDLARFMGVEALVVGSVTDFDAYYPPRMGMTVHWYAANPGFHPIPAGYGLPWGTEQEKSIPARVTREAEFELARSQLATQTPLAPVEALEAADASAYLSTPGVSVTQYDPSEVPSTAMENSQGVASTWETPTPQGWPDPTDLIPDPPSPTRPLAMFNHDPVLAHTRLFRGDDPDFTIRLAHFVESGDDARLGNWQGYLKRSDDFIHFCCHLHIMEMLESRGGRDESDLILRWPLSRY
jgi:hypothetical protein